MTYGPFDYNRKDIAKYSEISWNTLNAFWGKLVEKGIVIRTRKVGKSEMYKLNTENPIVQKLRELDKKLILMSIEEVSETKILESKKEMAVNA